MYTNSDLVKLLRSFKNEVIVYVPNPGNAGDSFITAATYQLFADIELKFEIGDVHSKYINRIVIYGGGGNLVNEYTNAITFIMNNHDVVKVLVVLPHTINSYEEQISNLDERCHLFCREKASYDYVLSSSTKANVYLSHDLAINADLGRLKKIWLSNIRKWKYWKKSYRNNFRIFGVVLKLFIRSKFSFETLNVFRNDVEKTDVLIPGNNLDASALFAMRDMSIESSLDATCKLMTLIGCFSAVKTNRLHVCILSLKMGKKVDFYANSYFKNKAIWEHSLKSQFPNLQWHG